MTKKEFEKISNSLKKAIMERFAVPSVLCGSTEVFTADDIEKAKRKFCKETLLPILKRISRKKK